MPRQEQLGSDAKSHQDHGKQHGIWWITTVAFGVFHSVFDSVFDIAKTRSRHTLEKLVGEAFAGYLNHDYFTVNCSFAWNLMIKDRYWWAPLRRARRFLSEKHPDKSCKTFSNSCSLR